MSNIDFREYSAAFHYSNDDICHFGILGMKWGVRRYQNPDGTLTEAGRKRYDRLKARADMTSSYAKELKENFDAPDKEVSYWNKRADKLNKKADKYGVPDDEKSKEIKSVNESLKGFKKSEDGDSLIKRDGKDDVELLPDNNGNYEESKKSYAQFNKNKQEHMKQIRSQMIDDLIRRSKNWDMDDSELSSIKKDLDNASFWITVDGKAIDIMSDAIEGLGYHSFSGEYDVNTKKLRYIGLEG